MVEDDLSIKEAYSLENLDADDVQIELQSFVVLIHDLEKILRPDQSE